MGVKSVNLTTHHFTPTLTLPLKGEGKKGWRRERHTVLDRRIGQSIVSPPA